MVSVMVHGYCGYRWLYMVFCYSSWLLWLSVVVHGFLLWFMVIVVIGGCAWFLLWFMVIVVIGGCAWFSVMVHGYCGYRSHDIVANTFPERTVAQLECN